MPERKLRFLTVRCNMPEKLSTTDIALELLNRLQAADPQACATLVSHKVQVPAVIADSDDFICQTARGEKFNLSVLGLINSVLVRGGDQKLAAIIDDDGTVIGFTKRFTEKVTPPAPPAPPAPPK